MKATVAFAALLLICSSAEAKDNFYNKKNQANKLGSRNLQVTPPPGDCVKGCVEAGGSNEVCAANCTPKKGTGKARKLKRKLDAGM